jgi:hypothetical protein
MTNHWIISEQIMNLVYNSQLTKKIQIKPPSQKGQIFKVMLKKIKKTLKNEF